MKKIFGLLLCMFAFITKATFAATLPSGFVETQVASGINRPTAMELSPDGRIFVAEQAGRLRVIKNKILLPVPFLSLTVDSNAERGLIGVAFDPNFSDNGYIYVYYTAPSPSHNRISRFTASKINPDIVEEGSEKILYEQDAVIASIHNGGAIHFGKDGKLYFAHGDNKQNIKVQSLNNSFGKIFRLNSDGTIPFDNPFYNTTEGKYRAIWAYGLRNPFTFAIQPNTGRMFINDVGETRFEEINDGIKGANYGWPQTEGYTTNALFVSPFFAYPHGGGDTAGCAITGGTFYNPSTPQFPKEFIGDYFFADYCAGWIRRLDVQSKITSVFAKGIVAPIDLKIDSAGNLYYLARGSGGLTSGNNGVVFIIQHTASRAPVISVNPNDLTVGQGQSATFSCNASGSPIISYKWQIDDSDIVGATSNSYTISNTQLSDNGKKFRCVATNSAGSATSSEATLTVISGESPTATIDNPSIDTFYKGGDIIYYSGFGLDPDEGNLSLDKLTWWVDFYHDDGNLHAHPFIQPFSGINNGSFVVPINGETSPNVWYRVFLKVVDSTGLSNTSYRDIFPRKSTITLVTNPSGFSLNLDGEPFTTPATFMSVVGLMRTLQAVSPITVGCKIYEYDSWSDGSTSSTRNFPIPEVNTKYTANYRVSTTAVVNGLCGTYYNTINFTESPQTRIDPSVNFIWNNSPIGSINQDSFSIRWTGFIQPQFSGTYTIYALSNDGVRVWISNQLIIDDFVSHWDHERSGTISFQAGQKYPIKIEYFDNTSKALMKLSWSSSSTPKQVVPRSVLFIQ